VADRLVLRDMTVADLADGLRLSRASGWNQTLDDWRIVLSLGPGLFLVAVEEDRVVATGGAVRYGRALAWICMILVDPPCRGRGLGTRVFEEVLARVEEARSRDGLEAVGLDATPAGRALYLPRGFVDGPALVRMRRDGGPPPADRDEPAPIRAMREADLDAVLALDRQVFGADRAVVLRDALASAQGLALVAEEAGRLRGYCFGRHGDHSDHVGPVVAESEALGRSLVLAAAASCARPVIVDARAGPSWTAALEAAGFAAQRTLTRMYRGPARPPARPALELAIRGPEMG
jgi:ribosomal protein S18 acetylase RimI-like enzyme